MYSINSNTNIALTHISLNDNMLVKKNKKTNMVVLLQLNGVFIFHKKFKKKEQPAHILHKIFTT
jgi:hypothetical protein